MPTEADLYCSWNWIRARCGACPAAMWKPPAARTPEEQEQVDRYRRCAEPAMDEFWEILIIEKLFPRPRFPWPPPGPGPLQPPELTLPVRPGWAFEDPTPTPLLPLLRENLFRAVNPKTRMAPILEASRKPYYRALENVRNRLQASLKLVEEELKTLEEAQ